MGELLNTAYQAQLDGEFDSPETAKQWLSDKLAGCMSRRGDQF